jgi:hypothetical protein
MADFGNILNNTNKTLDLYCNSINCNNVNVINPYLYAKLDAYSYSQQIDVPLIFSNVINNKINVNQFPKITFDENGVYLLTASISGNSVFQSVADPVPNLSFKVFDSNDNLIDTSFGIGSTNFPFGASEPRNISQSYTVKIETGYYVYVVLAIQFPPVQFNINFNSGNLNVCKISN